MNYTYPSDVYRVEYHTNPDLHVRLYLDRVLQGSNTGTRDNSNKNSYINDNITADQVDGKGGELGSLPLVMPRLTYLDKDFRTTKLFGYGLVLKDLKVGHYEYVVEFRQPDKIESGANGGRRIIGDLVEYRRGSFVIEHSVFDRVICTGKDQEGKPVYKSFGEMLLALHRINSLGSVVDGIYGDSDMVIKTGNLPDGEVLEITLADGDPKLMARGYKKDIKVYNGVATLENAPNGKYMGIVKKSGERIVTQNGLTKWPHPANNC